MKKKLIERLPKNTIKVLPVNYSFIFQTHETDLKKAPSKYIYNKHYKTNVYLAEPFYKPISTTFPDIINK
jgi:hypothetical protein